VVSPETDRQQKAKDDVDEQRASHVSGRAHRMLRHLPEVARTIMLTLAALIALAAALAPLVYLLRRLGVG
jgi:hypothetical protein